MGSDKPRILAFKATGNLGDNMQTVALSRLVGPAVAFWRDQACSFPSSKAPSVAAGFIFGPKWWGAKNTVLAGVFYPISSPSFIRWVKASAYPVGARDPYTYRSLVANGIPSELVGCVTLTLPRYSGPRSGEVYVDVKGVESPVTHKIPTTLSFSEEWDLCLKYLDLYRRASLVHTTRIHVAMPCIAMGTPVRYLGPMDGRASIVREIGLRPGEPCLPSVDWIRSRYLAFLRRYVKIDESRTEFFKPEEPSA